jgi:hypothetical protein
MGGPAKESALGALQLLLCCATGHEASGSCQGRSRETDRQGSGTGEGWASCGGGEGEETEEERAARRGLRAFGCLCYLCLGALAFFFRCATAAGFLARSRALATLGPPNKDGRTAVLLSPPATIMKI